MPQPSPVVLVADDDHYFVDETVVALLGDGLQIVKAYNVYQAAMAVERLGHLDGALIDENMPGGRGLDVVAVARRKFPDAVLVLYTGFLDTQLANRSFTLGAQYVVKQDVTHEVNMFAQRVRGRRLLERDALSRGTQAFAKQFGLSLRQLDLVRLYVVDQIPRGRLADFLGLTENSVKTHIRGLLAKCGLEDLDDVRWQIRSGRF